MFVSLSDVKIDSAAIYYLVVEQFYGKHDLGYDIYAKHKSKKCLYRYLRLIRSFDKHGWIDNYQITNEDVLWWFYSNPGRKTFDSNRYHNSVFLTPNYDILNGKHRVAIAIWHQISKIPCIIDDRYIELRSLENTFTSTENKVINDATQRMHNR